MEYPTTPEMFRHITLWNCCIQKSQWPAAVWRELPYKTQPFKTHAENIYPVMLASFLFTDEKIYSGHTEKPTEWLTECICSNQDDRLCNNMPVHKISVQLLTASVGEPQVVVFWQYPLPPTPVWYLSTTKSRLARPIILTWCHYDSFCLLYVRSQASSSSFSRTVLQRTQRLGSQLSFL